MTQSGRTGANGLQRKTMLAMAATFCMLAHQVAGKAARDGYYLSEFPATDLPRIVAAAAVLSVCLALTFSKFLRRLGPETIMPSAFALSAALHVTEWYTYPAAPQPAVVFVYLHLVGFGAVLLSGFWLLLSEIYDSREAKQSFGRIAASGTVGGIAGGLAAERVVAAYGQMSLLFLLASLHVVCSMIAWRLRAPARQEQEQEEETLPPEAFRRTPLLWQLAGVVFLGSLTAALLDYIFKSGAITSIGRGPTLVRFFAVYYTGCQVLTFLVQVLLTQRVMERLGIAKTVATMPVAVGAGSVAALFVPAFPISVAARVAEAVARGSLFRSGYEMLYGPVPPNDKRAVKTIIDVGCDRMGDAVGAGMVQLFLLTGLAMVRTEILGLALAVSAVSAYLALRIGGTYSDVLAQGLLRRAQSGPLLEAEAMALGDSLVGTTFRAIPTQVMSTHATEKAPQKARPAIADPVVEALIALRSGDLTRVAIALEEPWEPLLATQAIQLLAWDEVSQNARRYLEKGGSRVSGQIIDTLLDASTDFSIRRRIPRILARCGSQHVADGLIAGLGDSRFEVRVQCGRALNHLKRHHSELSFSEGAVHAALLRELSVSKTIWQSRRFLDKRESGDQDGFLDGLLKDRANQNLEHVFTLLALTLPREPLMAAFRGLHEDNVATRDLALDYLESVLPRELRERLWQVLEVGNQAAPSEADPDKQKALLDSVLRASAQADEKQRPDTT